MVKGKLASTHIAPEKDTVVKKKKMMNPDIILNPQFQKPT